MFLITVLIARAGQTNADFLQQRNVFSQKSFLKEAATADPLTPTATSVKTSKAEGETNNGKEIP